MPDDLVKNALARIASVAGMVAATWMIRMAMPRFSLLRRGLAATVAALAVASLGKPLSARRADAEKGRAAGHCPEDDAFQKGDVKACAVLVTYLNKPVRPDGKPGAIGYLTPVFEKQGGPWMLAFTQSPDLQAPARPRRRRQARCSRWCRGRPDRTVP